VVNFYEKIKKFHEEGLNINDNLYYFEWNDRVKAYLIGCNEEIFFNNFNRYVSHDEKNFDDRLTQQLEILEAIMTSKDNSKSTVSAQIINNPSDVFIVHGHDKSVKEATARFIKNLNLNPIILHEKANSGNTVIEKFEINANVGYAIILLTYDDEGKAKKDSSLQPRARQNVIFELGYFFGKIGRSRVCVLFEKGVEIPSDYKGILYIELDEAEGWKRKLAQELVNANMSVDLKGVLD